MNEPEGKITVVMPTGKRMNAIESIADAIAYNAQAAMSLTKVIENLETPNVSITNSNIQSSGIGISIKTEEYDKETGVYYWDRNDHGEYEKEHVKDYPSEIKTESGYLPEDCNDDYEDKMVNVRGIYRRKDSK